MSEESVNGGDAGGGGLATLGNSLQSQLASAFSALDETDQYDAVLTGLCAKILDDTTKQGDDVKVALQDSINLLQEMNTRRVKASGRSLSALIDVSCFTLIVCVLESCCPSSKTLSSSLLQNQNKL